MGKIFLFFCLSIVLYASSLLEVKKVSLKKDQTKKILVKYTSVEKLLKFRWTLYHNEALVLLSSYDRIPSQHILRLNYKNQSLRITLKPSGGDEFNPPYLIIKFLDFDFKKKEAKFSISISDNKQEIYLKYLN
jgi:hypothetical protein